MSLYALYNKTNLIDKRKETDKFIGAIKVRCGNRIVCGDKLPYHITDIKPHVELSLDYLQHELLVNCGIGCTIKQGCVSVWRFCELPPENN